ncbi:MAG: DUF3696 domain-containing protein, partial [Saprospiraceae bacterium]
MQLSNLNFSNFKNWKNFNTDLTKINLFFGQNSSGKSSIIQLLLLLKQTVENTDDKVVLFFGDNKSYVNLGNFDEIINREAINKILDFGIGFDFLDNLMLNVKVSKSKNGIVELSELKARNIYSNILIVKIEHHYHLRIEHLRNETKKVKKFQHINSFYKVPNESLLDESFKDSLDVLEKSIKYLFSRMIYIGPLRENPKREYKWTGSRHSHFGIRGENTFDAIITSIKENEKYVSQYFNFEGSLAEIVGNWLIEFGMADDFQIIPISEAKQLYQVNVKTKGSKNWVDICDVGFGVSQILPIIALCYYAPMGSILIIEQPEIHLHPKVQSGLGDLLIDAALSGNIQFIIESHSEHLLTRIQRRIAEEKIDDKDVKINFCNLIDGESVLEELEVDDFGEIINWPENFFGDEMEEIYQMQNAILKRK